VQKKPPVTLKWLETLVSRKRSEERQTRNVFFDPMLLKEHRNGTERPVAHACSAVNALSERSGAKRNLYSNQTFLQASFLRVID